MTIHRLAGVIVSACCAASCAPPRVTGRDFPRAAFAAMQLRHTTDQQAEALLGPPYKRLSLQTAPPAPYVGPPINIIILSYAYAMSDGGPTVSDHPVDKRAALVFLGGTLAAYDLNSTIPDDANQPIDDGRVAMLKQGKTTRNDIISLLGTPDSQSTAVPYRPGSRGTLFYIWTHYEGDAVRHKILGVELDGNDVMPRYALIDQSGPLPDTKSVPYQAMPPAPYQPRPPATDAPPLTTRS